MAVANGSGGVTSDNIANYSIPTLESGVARRNFASVQFIFSSPPDFYIRPLAGFRATMVWRMQTGRAFNYTPPSGPRERRNGPPTTLTDVSFEALMAYEDELVGYAVQQIGAVPGVRLIGTPQERVGVVSFVMDAAHPHDVGTVLDQDGIAVRAGHHCSQPVMDHFGVPATVRASFALYNTPEEVDTLVGGLRRVNEIFG